MDHTASGTAEATAQADAVADALAEFERLDSLTTRLGTSLLDSGRLTDLLAALAETVGCPVVFDDFAQQLVAFATVPGVSDKELLNRWEAHRAEAHGTKGSEQCLWRAISLHDEDWGVLHVLTEYPDRFQETALERTVTFVTLWLRNRRDTAAFIDGARSELIADLWGGRRWSRDTVLQRFRSVGGDLDLPVLQAVAIRVHADELSDVSLQSALQTALERLRTDSRRHRIGCLAAVVESTVVGIVGLTEEQSAARITRALGHDVVHHLVDRYGEPTIAVGISRGGTVTRLRPLITEAVDAARHGAEVTGANGVYSGAELGLLRLLGAVAAGPELRRFVDGELGPLLAVEPASREVLLDTLRAYLEEGGNKSSTAKRLHIERRTLYYRLDRLERVFEEPLSATAVRLRLHVALHGFDVLQRRGRALE